MKPVLYIKEYAIKLHRWLYFKAMNITLDLLKLDTLFDIDLGLPSKIDE